MAAAAACLLVALSMAAFRYEGLWNPTASTQTRTDSIAILPFESRNSEIEYLADGLTDGIISNLSRLSRVRVIDRNSVFQYKNKAIDPAELSRKLDVRSIITGQIEQTGDTLVITAELTDPSGNSPPWRQQFTRSKSELIVVQQEIVEAIMRDVLLGSGEQQPPNQRAKRPTDNAEAYDLYLKGRYYWNKRTNLDFRRSIEMFKAAIDKDPTFAKAYVALGEAYSLADINGLSADERVKLAEGAVRRALEIDDTIGEAYAVIGINKTYIDWDLAGAEASYRRALELNPNDATTRHWYAELLSMDGRFDESYRQYAIAQSLDPLSMPIRTDTAFAHYVAHDYDGAIEILNKAKELEPDYRRTYDFLSFAYREKGMFNASADNLEKRVTLQYEKQEWSKELYDAALKYVTALRNGTASRGEKGFWKGELEWSDPTPIYKAVAYSKLGENEKAFEFLDKAFNAHQSGMVWLKVTPEFDRLRSDPRYNDLLRRIGFRLD